jgi:DNA topoisomerase-6 subunit A
VKKEDEENGDKKETRGAGEPSFSVRQRAFKDKDTPEQASLPVDEGLPPGIAPGRRKKRQPAKEAGGKKRARGQDAKDARTMACIDRTATGVHDTILKGEKPDLKMPVRALSNVKYKEKVGFFELGKQKKVRTLTVNTVKTFAQSLRMMSLSKEMIVEDTFATKRDAYYQSKNWEEARFDEQTESDAVMDDIEAMFSLDGVTREELRFYPEEHGGAVAGELIVIDRDPVTGGTIEVDCTRFGSGAYTIPHSVEHLKFRTKAKYILAIETGGMFQRLQYHAYPSKAGCIIISMGGVPTRACRRFIRRLSEDAKIPVYAFVDCDPYGISNIYRSLKVGSGNAAHINRFYCVPNARMLGVTPDDIVKYKLPTHPLKDVDIQRARDALKNDPFFHAHKVWSAAMEKLLKMGVRAEQQALAKWGLNYVMDVYLPAKLKEPDKFLP